MKFKKSIKSCLKILHPKFTVGMKESPTPLLFTSDIWFPSSRHESIAGEFNSSGYTVGLLDFPGQGKAQSFPTKFNVDDMVSDLHDSLAPLCAAPVVVSSYIHCGIWLKVLESWPIASLVMLNPFVHYKNVPKGSIKKETLDMIPLDSSIASSVLIGSSIENSSTYISSITNEVNTSDDSNLCGLEASKALMELLEHDPVNLEPDCVPMWVLQSDSFTRPASSIISSSDIERSIAFHGLDKSQQFVVPTDGLDLFAPNCRAKTDSILRSLIQQRY
jgi:hypothetical protein